MSFQSAFQATRGGPDLSSLRDSILQRSYDCGQHTIGGSRCDNCSKGSLRQQTQHASTAPVQTDGIGEEDLIHLPMIEEAWRGMGLPETGVDEFGNRVGPAEGEIKYGRQPRSSSGPSPSQTTPPAQTPRATPCPTSVSVGAIAQRNHSNLSESEKEQWGTWLGAMSRMDVGPGPDHTGHCMKERLTTVTNTCPATMYSRGEGTGVNACQVVASKPLPAIESIRPPAHFELRAIFKRAPIPKLTELPCTSRLAQ